MIASSRGRFTTPDPLLSSGYPVDPQSWNKYSYVKNRPLNNIDPSGLWDWDSSLGGRATDDELRDNVCAKAQCTEEERKAGKRSRQEVERIIAERERFRQAIKFLVASFYYGDLVLDNVDTSVPPVSVLNPMRYSFVNPSGQKVFEGTYEQVSDFAEGLAAVMIKDKWGYLNKQGQLVIPARFDSAASFSEGLAYVGLGDERYFIDRAGKVVFKAEFSILTPFTNGLAQVLSCATSPCKSGYINKTGAFVWQATYHNPVDSVGALKGKN
jgi:hypothetical protein